jgi:hypothetical protein
MSGSEIQPSAEVDHRNDNQDDDGPEPVCLNCFGEGFVDSVIGAFHGTGKCAAPSLPPSPCWSRGS